MNIKPLLQIKPFIGFQQKWKILEIWGREQIKYKSQLQCLNNLTPEKG